MKKKLVKFFAFVLLVACIGSCNTSTHTPPEPTHTENVTETTKSTVATTFPEAETALTEQKTTVTEKPLEYSYDKRVKEYITQLDKLDKFRRILPDAEYGIVCDMNSDGTPEVILQETDYQSLVFSVDKDGAFIAEPVGGTPFTEKGMRYSYSGDIPKSFILLEEDQFFAECLTGDDFAGMGGIVRLNLNGRKLSSEYVSEYSYGEHGFIYRGFENKEQYNDYIRTFFGNLEPQWKKMPYKDFRELNLPITVYHVVTLLEDYYADRDELAKIDGQLNDDVTFDIEFKPVSQKSVDPTYTYTYDYDYAGNVLIDSGANCKYTYTYHPNGRIKTKSTDVNGYTEYDEDGNIINDSDPEKLTYDEKGRVKTRTVFYSFSPRDEIYSDEYFYKDDTDEIIKRIRISNGATQTTLYENGLEVSREWYNADEKWHPRRFIFTEYTPDGLVSKIEYFDEAHNPARTETFEYDGENRLIHEKSVVNYEFYRDESDRCNEYDLSYVYDNDGKLIYEKVLIYDGIADYSYTYDEYGNVIEIIHNCSFDNEMAGYIKGTFSRKFHHKFDYAGNIIETVTEDFYGSEQTTGYRPVRVVHFEE